MGNCIYQQCSGVLPEADRVSATEGWICGMSSQIFVKKKLITQFFARSYYFRLLSFFFPNGLGRCKKLINFTARCEDNPIVISKDNIFLVH
jgi:hypothetical protein